MQSASAQYIEGDLFGDEFAEPTIIAHVCNDQGGWGSGFVVPLGKAFPDSAAQYRAWHRGELTNDSLSERLELYMGKTQFVQCGDNVKVANMVAQTLGGKRPLFYNHLARCMDVVAQEANCDFDDGAADKPSRIICPMFGSGLAGGDWNVVERLIEDCWIRIGLDVTVYYFAQFLPDNFTPRPTNVEEVELSPIQCCYVKCIRCGAVAIRKGGEPPSNKITVGVERCPKCSGYTVPVTDAAEVEELSKLPDYAALTASDTPESIDDEIDDEIEDALRDPRLAHSEEKDNV